jgi:hypothetical protein
MRYITHMNYIVKGRRPLTQNLILDTRGRVGRKKRWNEDMQARFPEGTFRRIAAMLEEKEDRTDFVRAAVERELERHERLEPPARKRRR